MKFKSVTKLFMLIITTNCVKYLLTKLTVTRALHFVNENICSEGDSNGNKSPYGPVLHSYSWMLYNSLQVAHAAGERCNLMLQLS
jgi:hypothetical protein